MSLWLQPGLCSSWSCGESQEMTSNQRSRTMLPLLAWELSEQLLCPACVGIFLSFNTIGRHEDGHSVEAASAVFPYKAGPSSLLEKYCHNLTQDSGITVLVTVQPVALSIHGFALASSLLIWADNRAVCWAGSNYFGCLNYGIVHELLCSNNFSAKKGFEPAQGSMRLPCSCLLLPPALCVKLSESFSFLVFHFPLFEHGENDIYLVA